MILQIAIRPITADVIIIIITYYWPVVFAAIRLISRYQPILIFSQYIGASPMCNEKLKATYFHWVTLSPSSSTYITQIRSNIQLNTQHTHTHTLPKTTRAPFTGLQVVKYHLDSDKSF